MTEKTLSDAQINAGSEDHDVFVYPEQDVQEFIKDLKDEINIKLGEDVKEGDFTRMWGDNTLDFFELIDKRAGAELVGNHTLKGINSPQNSVSAIDSDSREGATPSSEDTSQTCAKCGYSENWHTDTNPEVLKAKEIEKVCKKFKPQDDLYFKIGKEPTHAPHCPCPKCQKPQKVGCGE